MKFKQYLTDGKKIPAVLKTMVKHYEKAYLDGNTPLTKKLKANIDKEIERLKLDTAEVYGKDRRAFDYGVVIPDRRKGK